MTQLHSSLVEEWQTLIAGVLALAGALITVAVLLWQAKDDRLRRSRAARALLLSALGSIEAYATAATRWLQEAHHVARRADERPHDVYAVTLGPPPEFDPAVSSILRECVEHSDRITAEAIAGLLMQLTSQAAALTDLWAYLMRFQNLDIRRPKVVASVDRLLAAAVELYALSVSFRPFARRETDKRPTALSFRDFEAAFRACELEPVRVASAWNIATFRFSDTEEGARILALLSQPTNR